MNRLIVVSVGFEEQLPLRGLVQLGVHPKDKVVLVYVSEGGEYEREKVRRALRFLETTLQGIGASITRVSVSGMDARKDLESLSAKLNELAEGCVKVIAVLAGGMRILMPLITTSLLVLNVYRSMQVEFMFMREDGLYSFTIPATYFLVPRLSARELELVGIIYELGGEAERYLIVSRASSEMNVTMAMIYRWLGSLEKKGAIQVKDDRVELTPIGLAIAAVTTRGGHQ